MATEVRRNICPNPSMETNSTGWSQWTGTGGTSTTTRTADGTSVSGGFLLRQNWTVGPTTGGGQFIIVGSDVGPDLGGKIFTASMYVRPSVQLSIYVQSQFFKNGSPTLAPFGPVFVCPPNVWTRVSYTPPAAGSGDNKVSWRWYINTVSNGLVVPGTNIDFDACLIEESATVNPYFDGSFPIDIGATYSWAGTVNNSESIQTSNTVTRKNKITNPGFEVDAVNWSAYSNVSPPTRVTTTPYSGAGRLQAVGANNGVNPRVSTTSNIFGILPGDSYVLSARVRKDGVWPSGGSVYLSIRWQLQGGGETQWNLNFPFVPDANGWMYVSLPAGIAPANVGSIVINIGFTGLSANLDVTGSLGVDEVLLEKSSSAQPYFDGSFPAKNGLSYLWTGTPDASESITTNTLPETRRNIAPNPNANGTQFWLVNAFGGTVAITNPDVTGPVGTKSVMSTWTVAANSDGGGLYSGSANLRQIIAYPGQVLLASVYVRCNKTQRISLTIYAYDNANVLKGSIAGSQVVLNPNEWTRLAVIYPKLPAGTDHLLIAAYAQLGTGFVRWAIGDTLECQGLLAENSNTVNPYFDGDSRTVGTSSYAWTGTRYQSESIELAGSGGSKGDNIFAGLVAGGYGPGSMADMEYKRLLSKAGLIAPQKLSLYDLYALTGERPRLVAFRG